MPTFIPIIACGQSFSGIYPGWEILLLQCALFFLAANPIFECLVRNLDGKKGVIIGGVVSSFVGYVVSVVVGTQLTHRTTGGFMPHAFESEPWVFGYITVLGVGAVLSTALGLYSHRVKKLGTRTSILLSVWVLASSALIAFALRPEATVVERAIKLNVTF